jgi:predicted dehydrogenase
MPAKLRFGVLGAARIALTKVIPAMQGGQLTTVAAIASRDLANAKEAASALNVPRAYGSYEELLTDPEIDAIYNPLPNPLHIPWTTKAAEAGKHVLCEKPLSLTAAEARTLLAVRARTGVKICEAFMFRSAPQWLRLRRLLDEGRIGTLRSAAFLLTYFNVDPANIRNRIDSGGGAIYDIGCYCISAARFAFSQEPTRVVATLDRDPQMGTDRLASAVLEFPAGHAIFTCSTQLIRQQHAHFIGTAGRIEMEIPFNAPIDRPTRLLIDTTGDVTGSGIVTETFPVADQHTLQGDAFARAVLQGAELPVTLEDSIANMAVIDAIFASANNGAWVSPRY